MDPVTTFGLVLNIVQLVDFTHGIIRDTTELIKSSGDSLPRNEWVEALARQNQELSEELTVIVATTTPSKIEIAIEKLARRCQEESAKLIDLLQPLKIQTRPDGSKSKGKAVVQILRSKLKSGDIESCQQRLESYERQLSALLLYFIKQSQAEEFKEIKELTKRDGANCVDIVRNAKAEILDKLHRSVESLRGVTEDGLARIEKRLLNAEERERAKNVIDSLIFLEMNYRKQAIEDHHGKTFDWTFSRRTPFKAWLEHRRGIFWVSGDAGSGKSTLMKCLIEDRRTTRLLNSWAGTHQLILADHYFWVAGSPMQKSFQGMLQNILHQILSKDPVLAKITCPDRWTSTFAHDRRTWSRDEVSKAISKMAEQQDVALCIFIDGLDECEERLQGQLLKFLMQISDSSNVKVCVSSRPWNIFEQAFATQTDKILLQDETRYDMLQYICDRLYSVDSKAFSKKVADTAKGFVLDLNEPVVKLSENETAARNLIVDMVAKANGVFLWVSIVLDTICARLLDGYSVDQLQYYVDEFPKRLEEYFEQQVFSRIADTYRDSDISETAMALKILMIGLETESMELTARFTLFWLLRGTSSNAKGMALNSTFGTEQVFMNLSYEELSRMAKETKIYLAGCCKDLLHVTWIEPEFPLYRTADGTAEQVLCDARVAFRHRTVYEFLSRTRMQRTIKNHVPEHFNTEQFASQLQIAQLKFLPADSDVPCHYILLETGVALKMWDNSLWSDAGKIAASAELDAFLLSYFEMNCQHNYLCVVNGGLMTPFAKHLLNNLIARGQAATATQVVQMQPNSAFWTSSGEISFTSTANFDQGRDFDAEGTLGAYRMLSPFWLKVVNAQEGLDIEDDD